MFWRVRQLFGQIKFSLWMKLQSRYFFRPFIHLIHPTMIRMISLPRTWGQISQKDLPRPRFFSYVGKGLPKKIISSGRYTSSTLEVFILLGLAFNTMSATHVNSKKAPQTDKTVLKCPGKGQNRWTCRCLHLFTQKWNLFRCHAIHPAIIWFQSLKLSFKQSWHGHSNYSNIAALYIPCTSHTSQGTKMTVRRIRIAILCDIVDLFLIGAAALACSRNN